MQNHVQSGRKPQFEVWVDNLPIVPRTENLSMFETYTQHIGSESKELKIIVYQGKSNHNDKYIFRLQDDNFSVPNNFSGFEGLSNPQQTLEGILNQKLGEAEQRWESQRLHDKVDGLTKEIEENEKYIGQLEERIKKFEEEEKNIQLAGFVGSIGGKFIDTAIQSSSKLQQFLGLGATEINPNQTTAQPSQIEFTPKTSEDVFTKLADQMRKDFTEEEFKLVSQIIFYLTQNKTYIPEIHGLIYKT